MALQQEVLIVSTNNAMHCHGISSKLIGVQLCQLTIIRACLDSGLYVVILTELSIVMMGNGACVPTGGQLGDAFGSIQLTAVR